MRYFVGAWIVMLLLGVTGADAQAKRNTRQPTSAPKQVPDATPTPEPPKRNERPNANRPLPADQAPIESKGPKYRYEFNQPDFVVSHIVIEHDDAGKGTLFFKRSSLGGELSESILISETSLERLRSAFKALDFIDSNENYQFERDFSNMGNVAITLKLDGKERTAKYNWTSNEHAKLLMDEYRRLANQFIWMFDFDLARQNQPLETPKLIDSFDGLLKRNEVSDPRQMLPFLAAISNDERVPLIGRNRAGKIVKQIEKQKK